MCVDPMLRLLQEMSGFLAKLGGRQAKGYAVGHVYTATSPEWPSTGVLPSPVMVVVVVPGMANNAKVEMNGGSWVVPGMK